MSNTITAYFKGRVGVAESVYQNDYGIVMAFDSIDLPAHFDCYFSRLNQEEALPGLGADNRVTIPNSILANPGNVTIHIPLHTGEDDSEVEYVIYFKVIGRARPIDDGTPAQMTAIERALALLSQPITNIEEIVNEALSFTGETFDEMQQDLDDWKDGVEDGLGTWKSNVESDILDVETDFSVLQGQFDTAVAAVTTDTEVTDIRVGADGVVDTTAGASVRRQFSTLSEKTKNLVLGIIKNCYINGSGKIITSTDYDMAYAPIVSGKTYAITTDDAACVLGYFSGKPALDATSYDGSRVVSNDVYTFTAPITGYVAFRTLHGSSKVQLEEGSAQTSYVPHITATDYKAREKHELSGDMRINSVINTNGVFVSMNGFSVKQFLLEPNKTYKIIKTGSLAAGFRVGFANAVPSANTQLSSIRNISQDEFIFTNSSEYSYCLVNAKTDVNPNAVISAYDNSLWAFEQEVSKLEDIVNIVPKIVRENLYNKNSASNVSKAYIIYTGSIVSIDDTRFGYSHLIPVSGGDTVKFNRYNSLYGTDAKKVFCYNGSTFVSAVDGVESTTDEGVAISTAVIPLGVNAIRINLDLTDTATMAVVNVSYPSHYLEFDKYYGSDDLIIESSEQSAKNALILENIQYAKTFKTIYSWNDMTSTGYYILPTGQRVASAYRRTSDYIVVKPNDVIRYQNLKLNIGGDTNMGIACYDENKNFLIGEGVSGSTDNLSGEYTIPSGVKYIAVSDSATSSARFDIPIYEDVNKAVEEYIPVPKNYVKGKKIAVFGDSIFAIAGTNGHIADFLAQYTEATIDNFALGGTGLTQVHSNYWKYFDFPELISAVISGDFTNQESALTHSDVPDYFADVIDNLGAFNATDYDCVILSYGSNDYTADIAESTIKTGVSSAISTMYSMNANWAILFDLPHYRMWDSPSAYVDDAYSHLNGNGNTLIQFNDFMMSECDRYGIPYCDNLHECGWNYYNRNRYFPSGDGAHFNSTACRECAKRLFVKLNEMGYFTYDYHVIA